MSKGYGVGVGSSGLMLTAKREQPTSYTDDIHCFRNTAQRGPIDSKNTVVVLILRVGGGGQKKDTSREGRNEGLCLEFAGDVGM